MDDSAGTGHFQTLGFTVVRLEKTPYRNLKKAVKSPETRVRVDLHSSLRVRKVILESHLPELLRIKACIFGNQGFHRALLNTLGGDLGNHLVLTLFKVYFATDRSIYLPVDRPGLAYVVPSLVSLFS